MYDEERWPTAGLATASAELSAGVGRSPFAQQPPATPPSKSSNAAAGGAIGRRPRERAPRREASSPMPLGTPLTNAASTKGARARKERPPCREGLRGLSRVISGVTMVPQNVYRANTVRICANMCESLQNSGNSLLSANLCEFVRTGREPTATYVRICANVCEYVRMGVNMCANMVRIWCECVRMCANRV